MKKTIQVHFWFRRMLINIYNTNNPSAGITEFVSPSMQKQNPHITGESSPHFVLLEQQLLKPINLLFFFFSELFTVSSDGRRSARGYQLTARAAVGTPLLYVAHITKNDYWINNKTSISNWIGGSNYSQLHAIYFKTLKDINLSRTPYALRLCLIKTIFLFYGRWQLLWEPILIIRMKCN